MAASGTSETPYNTLLGKEGLPEALTVTFTSDSYESVQRIIKALHDNGYELERIY